MKREYTEYQLAWNFSAQANRVWEKEERIRK
jgi:hypothetical protein